MSDSVVASKITNALEEYAVASKEFSRARAAVIEALGEALGVAGADAQVIFRGNVRREAVLIQLSPQD